MPMLTDLAKPPVLPVVMLQYTSNPASFYTFNAFQGVFDFRLVSYQIRPPVDAVGGRFDITITSKMSELASLSALYNNIEEGNEAWFYVGKDDPSKVFVLRGEMEDIDLIEDASSDWFSIHIAGPDKGSRILGGRYIYGDWEQRKLPDGITLDYSDKSTYPENIIKDLLNDKSRYTTGDFTVVDQGLVYDSTLVNCPQKNMVSFFPQHQILNDVLSQIDKFAETIHWVDPVTMKLNVTHPLYTSTGILLVDTLDDDMITGWDPTKIGVITRKNLQNKRTAKYRFQRQIGIGGDKVQKDQEQSGVAGGYDWNDNNYLATLFKPQYVRLAGIQVWIGRAPWTFADDLLDVWFELHEDLGTTGSRPNGTLLRSWNFSKDSANFDSPNVAGTLAQAGGWLTAQMQVDLATSKNYWIVMRRYVGADSNHRYNWSFTNSGSGLVTATSTDGVTWTESTGTKGYAFRTYYSNPLLTVAPDPLNFAGASTKGLKEKLYNVPNLVTEQDLQLYLFAQKGFDFNRKNTIECTILHPDVILQVGTKVFVSKIGTRQTVQDYFVVSDLEYRGSATPNTRTGSLYQNVSLTRFIR
jgi:hypothetical protein